MNPELIGITAFFIMLLMMFLGVPINVCMALTGTVTYLILAGPSRALSMVSLQPYTTVANYTLSVLPVFILLGEFADISGMMEKAYKAANTWVGGLPGGLAIASVAGAALFAAVSGSSMACAVLMTRVALPRLEEYKYDRGLSAGAFVAGGTLGPLIPPGVPYVIYALLSDTSVGKLYMASMIPGVILAILYLGQIYIQCRINPKLGPRGPRSTWKERGKSFSYTWMFVVLFVIVMGGIWFGIFTATEAGSVGAFAAFLFALGSRNLTLKILVTSLRNTLRVVGMMFATIIGVWIFTASLTISGLSQHLATWVTGLNLTGLEVVLVIMVIYSLLGCIMDTMSMILLTLPIFLPICKALGVDLYWFGVLIVIQIEFASITPPVGMNLFVVYAMSRDRGMTLGTVYRGALPFCITLGALNLLIIFVPMLALYLPSKM